MVGTIGLVALFLVMGALSNICININKIEKKKTEQSVFRDIEQKFEMQLCKTDKLKLAKQIWSTDEVIQQDQESSALSNREASNSVQSSQELIDLSEIAHPIKQDQLNLTQNNQTIQLESLDNVTIIPQPVVRVQPIDKEHYHKQISKYTETRINPVHTSNIILQIQNNSEESKSPAPAIPNTQPIRNNASHYSGGCNQLINNFKFIRPIQNLFTGNHANYWAQIQQIESSTNPMNLEFYQSRLQQISSSINPQNQETPINVTIGFNRKGTQDIQIYRTNNIRQFRDRVAGKYRLSPEQKEFLNMRYEANELQDLESTLEECGIGDGHEVYCWL